MRTLVALTAGFLAFALNVASGDAAEWCAWYDPYTYNCGFHTLDQCRAAASGDSTVYCARNVAYGNAYDHPRRYRQPEGW